LNISKKNNLDIKNTINNLETQNTSSISNHESKKGDNYDEQFKLLANKFNEAVEVILELSESVNELESIIYSKKERFNNKKYSTNRYKLKFVIFVIFITLISLYVIFLPIDLNSINLFFDEILLLLY
tara:strand:+ start:476 stop:856 length:381 start_codon:yes stop_codon:yes gene_type:complete